MYLFGTGIPKQLYDTSHCVAANDRVVNQHNPLIFYTFLYGGELNFYTVKSCALSRRDKSSSDVLILNKSDTVRNTGFLTEAKCRVKS